ncbi:PIG-L family deacetylase [Aliifodinibius sp. S!AR15-10]|uniref:PIG-L deacetylase family protein n=1 Tax=Aliifodinibius sp. S!AR15-10 TaxID=2950437 RepID=UPI002862297C|nr:PIG-L family deacetylase [Aliifodinibius sp. S!AR15-10]MDR8394024.1 PIG-L family deacetylase [Aliifodinibius sp. S!AR15-10]
MTILYIFPHPDDESFGPAPAIAAQRRQGDNVYLLTLTKGEATKQRHRLGVSKQEMGEIRFKEMQCVEQVLDLTGMTVLDLPDSGLKKMNPIEIEEVIKEHIHKIKPDVIVTYAVHGVSGFEDHLVSHAVVKRAYADLKKEGLTYPKRLAFYTHYSEEKVESKFDLKSSKLEEINCWVEASDEDMEKFRAALDCYETYQQVIEDSGVKDAVTGRVPFEFFGEQLSEKANSLTEGLK